MGLLESVFPFETTVGDRFFLGVAATIAIGLLWLRFLPDVSIWGALVVSVVFGAVLVKWG